MSGQTIALVQAVYIHLLVDASRNVTRGHFNVTIEDLASALDVTEDDISAVLAAMQGAFLMEKRYPAGIKDSPYVKTLVMKEQVLNLRHNAKENKESVKD